MPDRRYIAGNHPPTLDDRLLAHCFEIVILILGIIFGTLGIVQAAKASLTPLKAFVNFSPLTLGTIGALLIFGGLIWLTSIVRTFDDMAEMWRYMRLGMLLSALGWGGGFASTFFLSESSPTTWVLCGGMFTASFLGAVATRLTEKRTRKMVAVQKAGAR